MTTIDSSPGIEFVYWKGAPTQELGGRVNLKVSNVVEHSCIEMFLGEGTLLESAPGR